MARQLDSSAAASPTGTWLLDLHSGAAWRDDAHDQAFGYENAAREWTFDRFMGHVASDDHEIVYDRYLASVALCRPWAFSCDVIGAEGEARRIRASGDFLPGDAQGPPRLTGFVMNVPTIDALETALRVSMMRLARADTALHASLAATERVARRERGEVRETMLQRLSSIARRAADALEPED